MSSLLLLVVLWPATVLRAQPQAYTPAQVERLAKLAELYGRIKFFHPYLGYKNLNRDLAYAQNAPLIARATTDAETAEAPRHLLAVLHDPATTERLADLKGSPVAAAAAAAAAAGDSMRVFWAADSTLVLQANTNAGADDYEAPRRKVDAFLKKLPRAHAVLLTCVAPSRSPSRASSTRCNTLTCPATARPSPMPRQLCACAATAVLPPKVAVAAAATPRISTPKPAS